MSDDALKKPKNFKKRKRWFKDASTSVDRRRELTLIQKSATEIELIGQRQAAVQKITNLKLKMSKLKIKLSKVMEEGTEFFQASTAITNKLSAVLSQTAEQKLEEAQTEVTQLKEENKHLNK
ncbi:hypothetical protein Dimus_033121 [Dionaea muscipula]